MVDILQQSKNCWQLPHLARKQVKFVLHITINSVAEMKKVSSGKKRLEQAFVLVRSVEAGNVLKLYCLNFLAAHLPPL